MKTLKGILFLGVLLCSSCYDDFVDDFDYSIVGFAINSPLRTVIADRDMEIQIGVSIGGKRRVDMDDWAKFEIDPSLLEGTGLELLPAAYYKLSDQDMFRVRKANLPVADVGVTFTPAFYDDPEALRINYALPIRIVASSLDSISSDREATIVAIKYISNYHGTYYVKGSLFELQDGQVVNTTTYNDKDLVKNMTRDLATRSTNTLERPGLANFVVTGNQKVELTVQPSNSDTHNVLVETADGGVPITDGEGVYHAGKAQPEFVIKYSFARGGTNYRAEETLVLRQDPLLDLRVETWR